MQENKNKVGRPRKFNERLVLDQALMVFWTKGYEATSISDLVKATNINPPTLYSSFGNKEQLFNLVVVHYVDNYLKDIKQILSRHDLNPHDKICLFLRELLALLCNEKYPKGCLLMFSILSFHSEAKETGNRLKAMSNELFHEILDVVNIGIEQDYFRKDVSADVLTLMILSFEKGLALQARHGYSEDHLLEATSIFLASLAPN